MSWPERVAAALALRRKSQTLRVRTPVRQGCGRFLTRGEQRWRNFSSNDYLGLSQHPAVVAAWQEGARRYGVGSGGSGHITGYSEAHRRLELRLAQWLGYPRALLFISGFAANHAVISALAQRGDRFIADRLSHASLLEAVSQSQAELRRFAHNSTAALRHMLEKPCTGQRLVITEGVFSMDGDSVPLAAIAASTREAGAWLLVDDAHGAGVTGEGGRGSCAQAGVTPELLIVTFGKAFGVSGAAVLCSEALADYLLQFARHLIYSTAMPPAQAQAISAALEILAGEEGETLRARLQDNIQRLRNGAAALPLAASPTAIQPLIVGDNAVALALADSLRERGFWVNAIRPPAVSPGSARLRLTLSAAHCPEDIDALLEALHVCCE
jgi:8-amino-7-oxononanoate synthase